MNVCSGSHAGMAFRILESEYASEVAVSAVVSM